MRKKGTQGVFTIWNRDMKPKDSKLYAKDIYGNRDPLPVEEAEKFLKKAAESLTKLPERYRKFYSQKLGLKWNHL